MASGCTKPVNIAIVGAGFSGTALVATLKRYANQPIHIYLFEKTGQFGAGDAYRTPFAYHLLNARASDMSALEDEPEHFVNWLNQHVRDQLETDKPIGRQFVPRVFYHQYLHGLLQEVRTQQDIELDMIAEDVVDIEKHDAQMKIITRDQQQFLVDKVVLALGNNPPCSLPFTVSSDIQCIQNPWDYTALNQIPAAAPVLIVGTGLSMVDAVLTLHHQQHRGNITAVSRRGLLPLPHSDNCATVNFDPACLADDMTSMMKTVRSEAKKIMAHGGDWRNLISAMRLHVPYIWQRLNEKNRRKFLRHVLPYWNIHRHRVHQKLHDLLNNMRSSGQLEVVAGRILSAKNGEVSIRQRQTQHELKIPARHIINCMGSSFEPSEQPLIQSLLQKQMAQLDTLKLGMEASSDLALKTAAGHASANCYVLGPPVRGEIWECIAVPEIRKQCKLVAQTLLTQ